MERPTREVRMICTLRMIGWERIDMCTVVPYEYMSVGGVLNGLIYLILSSPTRVDAVWREPPGATNPHRDMRRPKYIPGKSNREFARMNRTSFENKPNLRISQSFAEGSRVLTRTAGILATAVVSEA